MLNLEYQKKLIAHACGPYNNLVYTNSLEAFFKNYNEGFRRFEIDLILTKDNNLVSLHSPFGYNFVKQKKEDKVTLSSLFASCYYLPLINNNKIFLPKEKQINRKYYKHQLTPITVNTLAILCKNHPNVEFILDTKHTNPKFYMTQYNIIRDAFEKLELELNQLTPQFYNIEMAKKILKEFRFLNSIYTLYMQMLNQKQLLKEIAENKDIKGITISKKRYLKNPILIKKIRQLGKEINVHTIFNEEELNLFIDEKVEGIYTDIKKI